MDNYLYKFWNLVDANLSLDSIVLHSYLAGEEGIGLNLYKILKFFMFKKLCRNT